MTIVWSDGADVVQRFATTNYLFKVLTIPAGVVVPNQGVLLVSWAFDQFVGAAGTIRGTITGIEVHDASDAVIATAPGSTNHFTLLSPTLTVDGGSIWLAGATNGTPQTVNGAMVACLDNQTWPGVELAFPAPSSIFGGTVTGLVSNPPGVVDAIYGEATELGTGPVDFTRDPLWINIIRRNVTYSFCGLNIGNPVMTTSPQTFTPFAIGAFPANVTSIVGLLTLETSGIGSLPGVQAFLQVLDASANVLVNIPQPAGHYNITGDGGLTGFNFTVDPVPAGASGMNIIATWDFTPTGLSPVVKVGWQIELFCDNAFAGSYAVGIGQYTGSVASRLISFTIDTPGASFAEYEIDAIAHQAGRVFAQMIGF